ncbi:unnamed protein product [Polarella glacialis]|uniref:RNA helicase n=1 Tax=Polarella glacialis TaxID=89957 RepID=A0A813F9P5_POLGL|nr:unnamed protein product [Polarella glacialis]
MMSEILTDAQVVCSTLIGCGASVMKNLEFDMVLVDEASQATEPRALIAIGKLSAVGRLVLIGDQQQLPPTCVSKQAENLGLGTSLFARLLKEKESLLGPTMLKVQYRMHPLISKWPSDAFYGGQLENGVSAAMRPPPKSGLPWPSAGGLIFVNSPSSSQEATSPDGKSKMNLAECELVRQAAERLLQGTAAEDIGVISPYRGQVIQLRRALQAWPAMEVKTIDGFQGCEKRVILVSCVRCNSQGDLGFLADYRRLNVALTRAQYGLVVVGNRETLEKNPLWQGWLKFVDDHDLQVLL